MYQGWVKIHRTMLDWEWFNDSKTLHLFMYLLLKANHEQKSYRGIIIKRGELLTGRKKIAKETGLSEQSIRTSLNKLKSTRELTIKSTSKYSIINIVNYNVYQKKENEGNQQNNQQINQVVTNNQPSSNHKQEVKNEKNEKNEKKEESKTKYLDYIYLTDIECEKLITDFGEEEVKNIMNSLNDYIGSRGKKYKSHYHTIRSWYRKDHK